MLKYYITVSFRQFTKTLNQSFYLSSENEKFGVCLKTLNQSFYLSSENEKFGNLYTSLIWVTERSKAVLRYFYLIIFKQMDIISKKQNIMFAEYYYM